MQCCSVCVLEELACAQERACAWHLLSILKSWFVAAGHAVCVFAPTSQALASVCVHSFACVSRRGACNLMHAACDSGDHGGELDISMHAGLSVAVLAILALLALLALVSVPVALHDVPHVSVSVSVTIPIDVSVAIPNDVSVSTREMPRDIEPSTLRSIAENSMAGEVEVEAGVVLLEAAKVVALLLTRGSGSSGKVVALLLEAALRSLLEALAALRAHSSDHS
jgi:hypothetical protein